MRAVCRPCVLLSLVALLLNGAIALAGPVIAPGWGIPIFRDEFDGNAVDQSIWEVAYRANDANNEQQFYHPDQVSVADGTLSLRADRDPNYTFGRPYRSGLVRTWGEWSFGRFEARAKVPNGQGFWPAIWLLPRTAPWPSGGEIDIMEARGDRPYGMSSALHWGWDSNSRQYRSEWYESGANFQAGFHDYAVEWEPGTVRFYVDGVEHMRLYEPDVGIPSTPKSLILNLAVGGDYSGFPDGSTPFPSNFEIDYVRVWQRPEIIAAPSSMLEDPGFEGVEGQLTEWTSFGNTIDNVASDYGTPLDGERSLKLYGQFNDEVNYSGVHQSITVQAGERVVADIEALTRSEDSLLGSENEVWMKLEFYSEAGAEYESDSLLSESQISLSDDNLQEDAWSASRLLAVAPEGAVEARLAFVFAQSNNAAGSIFLDSASLVASLPGDYNSDGQVDSADYTLWRDAYSQRINNPAVDGDLDGDVDLYDYQVWVDNFGASLSETNTSTAVPEPSSLACLVLLGMLACAKSNRQAT